MKKLLLALTVILTLLAFSTSQTIAEAATTSEDIQVGYVLLAHKEMAIYVSSSVVKQQPTFVLQDIEDGDLYALPVSIEIYNAYNEGDYLLIYITQQAEFDLLDVGNTKPQETIGE